MLCHAGKHRLAGNGWSAVVASRADQTSERGLWARAHHTAERPSSSPSTAWQLLVDVEARYQCRMQHDWSRGGCQAVRKSPSGSRRARLE